jgi:ribosome-binding factor A
MVHSRITRVAELIKEELGPIIDNELQNPKLPEFVTVHSVRVAKDLRHADVYFTVLQDDAPGAIENATDALNESAGYIRQLLGSRITLKYLPELHFHYNPSTRYAANLENIFQKIEREPKPTEPAE